MPADSVPENSVTANNERPLFCDVAEEIRRSVDAYDAGWRMMNGHLTVSVDSLRRWAAAMERASLIIEGPAE